jgi:muramoyltetrapeptide carboxypeptidase
VRRLRPGDTVALVTPAGPVTAAQLDRATAALEEWGLVVKRWASTGNQHPSLPYLADGDERRAEDFQSAWRDPAVSAVISARGGYGTQRLLDLIDWAALAAAGPKVFTGSSDVTALHQAIAVHLRWETLFSPMPAGDLWDGEAAAQLWRRLFEPESPWVLHATEALVPGRARGRLIGGNLSLLAAGIGTPEHQPADGAIVALEDVTEHPYRLDRMVTHLLRAGWFDQVAGIALGSWTKCGDPALVREVMLDRLGRLGVPVLWGLPFGHRPGAATLPLGTDAVLDAQACTLSRP